eukprot:353624-Chlamydomonas_euryale.AAC.7
MPSFFYRGMPPPLPTPVWSPPSAGRGGATFGLSQSGKKMLAVKVEADYMPENSLKPQRQSPGSR